MSGVLRALVGAIATVQTRAGFSTLDPATKSASITLGGGNLQATGGNSSAGAAITTTSKSSGKWYLEWTYPTIAGFLQGSVFGGITGAGFSTSGTLGNAADSVGVNDSGAVFMNSSFVLSDGGGQRGLNDVTGIAIDIGSQLIWFKRLTGGSFNWNNSGSADPVAEVGGISFAAITGPYFAGIGFAHTANTIGPFTLNVGATTFTGSTPSGYSPWG